MTPPPVFRVLAETGRVHADGTCEPAGGRVVVEVDHAALAQLRPQLSPEAVLVLHELAAHARFDDEGHLVVARSSAEIADAITGGVPRRGWSARAVSGHINELAEQGFVVRGQAHHRGGPSVGFAAARVRLDPRLCRAATTPRAAATTGPGASTTAKPSAKPTAGPPAGATEGAGTPPTGSAGETAARTASAGTPDARSVCACSEPADTDDQHRRCECASSARTDAASLHVHVEDDAHAYAPWDDGEATAAARGRQRAPGRTTQRRRTAVSAHTDTDGGGGDEDVVAALREWGVIAPERFVEAHGVDVVAAWVREVRERMRQGRVDNPGAYLRSCVASGELPRSAPRATPPPPERPRDAPGGRDGDATSRQHGGPAATRRAAELEGLLPAEELERVDRAAHAAAEEEVAAAAEEMGDPEGNRPLLERLRANAYRRARARAVVAAAARHGIDVGGVGDAATVSAHEHPTPEGAEPAEGADEKGAR